MSDIMSQGHGGYAAPSGQGVFTSASRSAQPVQRPRLWPGVLVVLGMWLGIQLPMWLELSPMVQFQAKFMAPMVGMAGIGLWWLFASRVSWGDKFLILGSFLLLGTATIFLIHPSFGMGIPMYTLPALATAWVAWLTLTMFLPWPIQRAGLLVVFLAIFATSTGVRMDGVDGDFAAELATRWSPTPEERTIAALKELSTPGKSESASTKPLQLQEGDWPGFRGANRDSVVKGVRISTDWDKNPPKELWKKPVGPGWSSFAVVGDRLYTQEQRDKEDEVVACYSVSTGEQRWIHKDATRFTEVVAGPGPRSTPTFHEGKIYALGANGALNCLDAATGKPIWSRDIATDSGAKVPQWGFSASPTVAKGIVSVYVGADDKAVLGYKADTGELAWASGTGTHSYCSTQLSRVDGVEVLLVATEAGMTILEPASGKVLKEVEKPMGKTMARCVQPNVVNGNEVLLGGGFGYGVDRFKFKTASKGDWTPEAVSATKVINPYYNDFVVHKGHLYGFDSSNVTIFTCVDIETGESTWRQRGYGAGQVLLLPEQDLLLVLSEKGEVCLLKADTEKHTQLGKFSAFKGKTWNHPVIAGGKLFVRNGEWMACYQLPLEK